MGLLYQNTSGLNQLIYVADSLGLVEGNGSPVVNTLSPPNFQGLGWDKHDCSCAGISAQRQTRDPDSINGIVDRVLPVLSAAAPVNVVILHTICNLPDPGYTAAQVMADYMAEALELKRWGCIVLGCGRISTDGGDSFVSTCHGEMWNNTSGDYYWKNYLDAFWVPGFMSPFGQSQGSTTYPSGTGCCNGTYYKNDKAHLLSAGVTLMQSGSAGYDLGSVLTGLINNTTSGTVAQFVNNGLTASKYPLLNQEDVFQSITSGMSA